MQTSFYSLFPFLLHLLGGPNGGDSSEQWRNIPLKIFFSIFVFNFQFSLSGLIDVFLPPFCLFLVVVLLARPGMFDMKGKAKWDAWSANKGKSQEAAKEEYVTLADSLKAKYA